MADGSGDATSPHSRSLRLWRQDVPHETYFVRWCTAGGEPILAQDAAAAEVFSALRYAEEQAWVLVIGYVIMPDHVHILMKLEGLKPLCDVIRSLKGYTGRRIGELLGRRGPVWQDQYYEHLVRNPAERDGYLNYMAMNPVARGLAARPGEYKWASVAGLKRNP